VLHGTQCHCCRRRKLRSRQLVRIRRQRGRQQSGSTRVLIAHDVVVRLVGGGVNRLRAYRPPITSAQPDRSHEPHPNDEHPPCHDGTRSRVFRPLTLRRPSTPLPRHTARNAAPPRRRASTLGTEMPIPQPKRTPSESLELPVDEVLRRAKPHPPYGEHVIDDLTDEEAAAFLEAVLH
jgi:hypothetical protein